MKRLFSVTLAAGLAAAPALAGPGDWSGHMMWGGATGIIGGLMMLVFWGLIIAVLVLALRWLLARGDGRGHDNALAILRERLARGEIEPEEYERRRRVLEG